MLKSLQMRLLLLFLVATLAVTLVTWLVMARTEMGDVLELSEVRGRALTVELKGYLQGRLDSGRPLADAAAEAGLCRLLTEANPGIRYCRIESADGTIFEQGFADESYREFSPGGRILNLTEPIVHDGGEVAGLVRLGISPLWRSGVVRSAYLRSAAVGVAVLLVLTPLAMLFLRRTVVLPVRRACRVAGALAEGQYDVKMPTVTSSELSTLCEALRQLAGALKERDEQFQEGYRELEENSTELQRCYERQSENSFELMRSREMYRAILEQSSEVIVVSDEDDNILLLSRASEDFFGLPPEEVMGTNLFVALHLLQVEDIEQHYALMARVREGERVEGEFEFTHPRDGQRRVALVRGVAVAGADGRRLIQATLQDVTAERAARASLEKTAREMEQLSRLKNSFVGLASHELKTPLTVIVGYLDLIMQEHAGGLDEQVRTMLGYVSEASDRLSAIILDMVDVSMLDSKRMHLKQADSDLNEILRKSVGEVGYFLTSRKQELALDLAADLPRLHCDPNRIGQVIGNLLINAIKFTPDGGRVTVATRLRRTLRPAGASSGGKGGEACAISVSPVEYLEIRVADNGIGISEVDQGLVFDKFFEGGDIDEHFTSRARFMGKGTGLGLTIVKGIVELHGGGVWVDSAGHDSQACPGATFYVLLPLRTQEAPACADPGFSLQENGISAI